MTNLSMPRYRIIARWPDMESNKYYVGQLLVLDIQDNEQWYMRIAKSNLYDAYFDSFPYLFQKLEWWEEREIEEMPTFLKTHAGNSVRIAIGYNLRLGTVTFSGGAIKKLKHWVPATKEDHNKHTTLKWDLTQPS